MLYHEVMHCNSIMCGLCFEIVYFDLFVLMEVIKLVHWINKKAIEWQTNIIPLRVYYTISAERADSSVVEHSIAD